jgi:hypothetical protein
LAAFSSGKKAFSTAQRLPEGRAALPAIRIASRGKAFFLLFLRRCPILRHFKRQSSGLVLHAIGGVGDHSYFQAMRGM